MHDVECVEDFVHAVLILVHAANNPHVVVVRRYAVLSWEWYQRSNSLKTAQLPWELVFDKYTALWRTEVSTTLSKLLAVERLVDYTDAWSAIYRNTNHARHVVQVALCEAFGSIKGINPDDHLIFEELIGELIVVVVGLRRCHAVDLLHLCQVATITMTLHIVVLEQHFLTNVRLVKLVRHNVRALCCH